MKNTEDMYRSRTVGQPSVMRDIVFADFFFVVFAVVAAVALRFLFLGPILSPVVRPDAEG